MPKASGTLNKLLILCGPTATGKTAVSVHLARKFGGELVSADSRHVYRGIDITTGKDKEELGDVPVYLHDIVSVGEEFSVSQYRRLAVPAIRSVQKRGKLPILVGGTGLYINAVAHPPETIDIPPDSKKRKRWALYDADRLRRELSDIDPDRLVRMNASDSRNPRRLIRAIEIAAWEKQYGKKRSTHEQFDCHWIGLILTREALKRRIERRVHARWENGALREAELYPDAVATGMNPMRMCLRGEISKDDALSMWVREETAYAKRQMVWFAKMKNIRWYDADSPDLGETVEEDVRVWYTGTEESYAQ